MSAASTPTRYGVIAQTFHWLTVVLVGAAYLLGEGGPESRIYASERAAQLSLHETLGMAVLVLLMLRLAWRFSTVRRKSKWRAGCVPARGLFTGSFTRFLPSCR